MPPYAVHVDADVHEDYHECSSVRSESPKAVESSLATLQHPKTPRHVHFCDCARVRTFPRVDPALKSQIWYSKAEERAMIQIVMDRQAAMLQREPESSVSQTCSFQRFMLRGLVLVSIVVAVGLEAHYKLGFTDTQDF